MFDNSRVLYHLPSAWRQYGTNIAHVLCGKFEMCCTCCCHLCLQSNETQGNPYLHFANLLRRFTDSLMSGIGSFWPASRYPMSHFQWTLVDSKFYNISILILSFCIKICAGCPFHTRALACAQPHYALNSLLCWQRFNDFGATCSPFQIVQNPVSDGRLIAFRLIDLF